MAEPGEQTIAQTGFGTVTNRRVTYYYKKGWFNPGSQEDMPLRHITSVRLETSRHIVWGIIFALIGLGSLAAVSQSVAYLVVAIVFLGIAVLFFWGSPRVVVNTAGGDLRPAVGWPWTRSTADAFVKALRSQLFKD
jgi:hypothetical protein